MPSVSKKQHNLMAAVAHNPGFAKKVGIKQSVGRDFVAADKGKKFSKGGEMKKLFGGKESRSEELKEAKALKSGKISKSQYVSGEKSEGHGKGAAKTASAIKSGKITPAQYAKAETMNKGGKVKKMFGGGMGMAGGAGMGSQGRAPAGSVNPLAGKQIPAGLGGAPAAGRAGGPSQPVDAGKKINAIRSSLSGASAPRGIGAQGRAQPGSVNPLAGKKMPNQGRMAKGGLASGHKTADGCAIRGKTRGTEVKMAKGGKTKKYC